MRLYSINDKLIYFVCSVSRNNVKKLSACESQWATSSMSRLRFQVPGGFEC